MKFRTIAALTILPGLAALLAIAAYMNGVLRFNYPARSEFPIQGLDLSHHQSTIDWKLLNSENFDFVYIKATEGKDWEDPLFDSYWQQARSTKMKVGAYHYYRLNRTGAEQAANFIRTVPKESASLPPVVDLEEKNTYGKSKELIREEIRDYLSLIQAHYGKAPVIYSTEEFYNIYLKHEFPDTRIWMRNVFRKPRLSDGKRWSIWQFADKGRVRGIGCKVDLNAFHGSREAFKSFLAE